MLDEKSPRKIQVGAEPKTIYQREEGEKWTDTNGQEWVKENGARKQITKMPPRGFDKCKDCEKLILKDLDQDTYNRMQRCYHCQINFEVDLKAKNKWKDWMMGLEKDRWDSIEKELKIIFKEMKEQFEEQFDTDVAFAVGNQSQQKSRDEIKRETG
jgi:acetyl-CoA carboxylase beta subunit